MAGTTSVTGPMTIGTMTRDAVAGLSRRLGEPEWMREGRLSAWEAFGRLPLPVATQPEEWRRTDISALDFSGIMLPESKAIPAGQWHLGTIARAANERAGLMSLLDGGTAGVTLDPAAAAQGVIFTHLSTAIREHPGLVREHLFNGVVRPDEHRFRALHAALWSGGTFLYVPQGIEVALPLVTQTWLGAEGGALFPHTLVIAEQRSKVTLVELFASTPTGPRTFASGVVELLLRPGAQVRYASIQEWGLPMWEVGSLIRVRLARDASLSSLVVSLGGGLVKTDVESQLTEPGATSEMLGLYFGNGTQHVDFHTLQEHHAPHTTSDLLYKGAVKDTARAVFAGLIKVHPGAQKTNAFQANRNLILSEGARSDSMPKLEIMANDLRCTHGSATSRLNEEHIFYLMSRGLSRKQATFMIVEGFFADIFDRIPIERVRAYLEARIAEKMI